MTTKTTKTPDTTPDTAPGDQLDPLEAATARADALTAQAREERRRVEAMAAALTAAEDQAENDHWFHRRDQFAQLRRAADTSGKYQAFRTAVLNGDNYVPAYLDWQTALATINTERDLINAWFSRQAWAAGADTSRLHGTVTPDYNLPDGVRGGDELRRLTLTDHVARIVEDELTTRINTDRAHRAHAQNTDRARARADALTRITNTHNTDADADA